MGVSSTERFVQRQSDIIFGTDNSICYWDPCRAFVKIKLTVKLYIYTWLCKRTKKHISVTYKYCKWN